MSNLRQLRERILSLQDKAIPEPRPNAWAVPGDAGPEFRVLHAAKLIDIFDDGHLATGPHRVLGLTAEGQRFSEQIRDETAWNETLAEMEDRGESLTIENMRNHLLAPRKRRAESALPPIGQSAGENG